MNKLIQLSWILMVLQFALAKAAPASTDQTFSVEFIQPPTDKRYQLFDFIATKINDWNVKQLLIEASTYSEMLRHYNAFLESHQGDKEYSTPAYQQLKEQFERFIKATDKLKTNPASCDLQSEASVELEKVPKYLDFLANNNSTELLNIIRRRFNQATAKTVQDFGPTINDIYQKLPAEIQSFRLSLNRAEKQEYRDLLQCCDDFLAATKPKKKYQAFDRLTTFILQGKLIRSGNNSNCKWERRKVAEFSQKIQSWML